MVDLNALVIPGSQLDSAGGVAINDLGEITGDRALPNGDTHAFILIPCDENHPNIVGCDYSLVTAAPVQSSTAPLAQAPAASPANLSPAEMMTRLGAGRNRRYGMPQTSPK